MGLERNNNHTTLAFNLRAMRSHEKVVSMEITWSDLCFKVTLATH